MSGRLLFACAALALVTSAACISTSSIANLTIDYFSSKTIQRIVVFVCGSSSENTRLLRHLITDGGRHISVRLQEEDAVDVLLGQHAVGVVVLLDCPRARPFLQECSGHLLFNSSFHWLLISEKQNYPFEGITADLHLQADSEVVIAQASNMADRWDLVEVYKLEPSSDVQTRPAGRWSNFEGIYPTWSPSIVVRRPNIGGLPFRIVLPMPVQLPHAELQNLHKLPKDKALRIQKAVYFFSIHAIANLWPVYNMTITISSQDTPGEIDSPPGGKFHGSIGLIQRQQADMFPTSLMVPSRLDPLHFTVPIWPFRCMLVFLNPSALGSTDALTRPLHWLTWISVAIVSGVALLLYKTVSSLNGGEDSSWGHAMISTVGILTGNGVQQGESWFSRRTIILIFDTFCLLVFNFYSSSIVTFLLSPAPTTIFTVRELIHSPFRGASHDWFHVVRVLKESKDPLVRDLYHHFVKPPRGLGFLPMPDCMRSLRHSLVAVYAQDVELFRYVKNLPSNDLCRLREVDVEPKSYIVPGIGKHVTVKEHIRVGLVRQWESGVIKRLHRDWREPKPACIQGAGRGSTAAVGLKPIALAIVLLATAILLTSFTFIFELIIWRYSSSKTTVESV